MNYRQSPRAKTIGRICDRLQRLLEQEDDPEATMEYLLEPLRESGLAPNGLPTDSPMGFTVNLQEVLNQADPMSFLLLNPLKLPQYETAEELILDILPTELD